MKIKYNDYTLFHVHIQLQYRLCFFVRNTIIVIFQYLQQSYKMVKIKRTEVHRRQ